jgi:hypothetical protein
MNTRVKIPENWISNTYHEIDSVRKWWKNIELVWDETNGKVTDLLEGKEETKTLQEIQWFIGNLEALEKSWLEAFDLWEPICPDIIVNKEWEASDTEPQAREHEWKWYYNLEWAMKETEFLWKKIPTKEDWERICESYWNDWKKMSKELWLSFTWTRDWSGSSYYNKNKKAYYFSRTTYSNDIYLLYFTFSSINPGIVNNRANASTIRCLKN